MHREICEAASWVQEKTVQEFKCQYIVDLSRIVPMPAYVSLNDSFEHFPLEVRP